MSLFSKRFLMFFAALSFLAVSPQTQAATPRALDLGISLLSHGLLDVADEETGETSIFGTGYFNFQIQAHFPITDTLLLSPEILYMPEFLFPVRASGTSVNTTYTILSIPVVYPFGAQNEYDASAGLALLLNRIHGPGGTVALSNGNGTSNFAQPGRDVTTKTIALVLGAAYNSGKGRFALDLLTEGLLSNSKRTFSLMFTFSYSVYEF